MKRLVFLFSILPCLSFGQDIKYNFASPTNPVANQYAYTNLGIWTDDDVKITKFASADTGIVIINSLGKVDTIHASSIRKWFPPMNATGLIVAGTNISITGSGTSADPYEINSTGIIGVTWDDVSDKPTNILELAGITFSDNDIIQYISGELVNRTPAQLKTSLGLVKGDVGLSNVDNTSDVNKPISTATQNALNAKLSNITGLVIPGTNISITGSGTSVSPYTINSSGSGLTPQEIETIIADSSLRGKQEMAFMYGVLAPDSIPVALNSPMTWSFLISDSHHTYNFCIDSITASGSSLLVHYPLPCRINDIMYGVAGLDDAISGYGMTLGTGVGERWMAIAATAKIEIGGYYYFDSPNTITLGNGLKKNLNFSYDTSTAVLTVSNLATNNELLKEAWNLDVWYEGDHHYMFRQMRNSLPGSELTTLKWTLVDVVTGTPMTGARASSDVFRFRGNDVPVLVNLNLYDETTRDLIYYNSNIWVMVVGTKATHD